MPLARLFIDDSSATADIQSITAVAMVSRHELDAAVAVPVVVPVRRRLHPQAYFLRLWRKQGWVAPLRVTPLHETPLVRRSWVGWPYGEVENRQAAG